MKFSGIVYLYLDYTFCGWNRPKQQQLLWPGPEAAAGPLEVLPGDVAEDLHDGGDRGLYFLWEDLLIPFLDKPHFK